MRKIITYSTLGDNMKEVYSSAMTLGDLLPDLNEAGVRHEGMKLMTNPGQLTLESMGAQLPEGEFQLFIMPQKVKSGHLRIDEDTYMIDEIDGINWEDVDWKNNSPEEYEFKTVKDLMIARAKRAFALLEKSVEYLINTRSSDLHKNIGKPQSSDPILNNMREQAAKLQQSMNPFE